MMPHLEFGLRILVGTVLAGLIGFERDVHGRPAGLKTHVLVGLASATFMVVSTQLWDFQHYHTGQTIALDPSRIAAAVVTGVGFLGGGAILRTGLGVQGLTTAAGLWLVAAIGLCAGGGFYPEAIFVTLLGLLTLTFLRRFERRDELHRRLVVRYDGRPETAEAILQGLRELAIAPRELDYDRAGDSIELALDLRYLEEVPTHTLIQRIELVPQVKVLSVGQGATLPKDH